MGAKSKSKTNNVPPLGARGLLVIRLSAMGDVAMTVPVLLALKKKYPDVKVTILTKPHFESIFNSIKGVRVFSAEVKTMHKGVMGLWRLHRELSEAPLTHVADLHNVLRSKILGFFFWLKGVPVKKIDKGREEKRALTRSTNKRFQPLKTTMERYADVFSSLGFPLTFDEQHFLPKQPMPKVPLLVDILESEKHIGIAPFATYASKMYRLDLMEKVIEKLISTTNYKVFLFGGGKHEEEQLTLLESKFDGKVKSVAGKLSFSNELALISNLNVMLAMDSGNGHLAANYGVPVVTLWGVTHPYAGFAPYDQPAENALVPDREKFPLIPTSVYGNIYPEAYLGAINSILPDTVVEKVRNILDT